jgi:hypothetical protein
MNLPEATTESTLLRHSNGYLAACAIGIVFCWMQSLVYLNHVIAVAVSPALEMPLSPAQGVSSVRAAPGTNEIQRALQWHGLHDRQRFRSAAYSCECMTETGCAGAAISIALPSVLPGTFRENAGAESWLAEPHLVTFTPCSTGQCEF